MKPGVRSAECGIKGATSPRPSPPGAEREGAEVGGQKSATALAMPSPLAPLPSDGRGGSVPERLLTRQELAGFLQVCVRTVDSMVALGEIEALRIRGRLVRFRLEDVLRKLKKEKAR